MVLENKNFGSIFSTGDCICNPKTSLVLWILLNKSTVNIKTVYRSRSKR